MAKNTENTAPNGPRSIDALAGYLPQIAYGLFGLAAVFAALLVAWLVMYKLDNLPILIWSGACAVLMLGAGLWLLTAQQGRLDRADTLRLVFLTVLGLLGFVTALLGLALPLWQYREELSGGLKAWRENRGALTLCAAAFLGGLVLMFLGVFFGRTYERTRPALRRLLYGYNAVLSALLLLCILGLANILPYSPVWPLSALGAPLDWTAKGIYTLQPESKNVLASIDKPVKIYVILPAGGEASDQVTTLLENCRAVNGLITWEMVSRDLSREKLTELSRKYSLPSQGLLILYGTEPDVTHEVVKADDLFSIKMNPRDGSEDVQFKGESALIKALSYLTEGQSRAVVYFTQGNGELSFQRAQEPGQSMGLLLDQLRKGNYELRPLPFDRKALADNKGPAIPEDAQVVVVAGPRTPLSQEAVDALRRYMAEPHGPDKRKGKLVVLSEVVADESSGKMVQTGLEPLLRDFNVELGNDYVVSLDTGDQYRKVFAVANPRSSSQVARAFVSNTSIIPFLLDNARTVKPLGRDAAPRPSAYAAQELLITIPNGNVWAETDLTTPTETLLKRLKPDQVARKTAHDPLSLAVTVTEGKEDPMLPPGHPPSGKDQTPRLVVVGDASWVSDELLVSQAGRNNTALLNSCLAWLRERPNIGPQPQDKEHPTYSLNLTDGGAGLRMILLPPFLMLMGVVTLGLGVWFVRRR